MRAQPFAERQEVIILHPDDVVLLDQRKEAVRELLVDAFIAATEFILIFGKVDAVVKERPQRAVGIAVVIFLDIMGFEVDRCGGEAVDAFHRELAGELFDLVSRPAEPYPAAFVQRRAHRDRKPALRSRRAAALRDRHAVRDDDQPAHRTVSQPRDSSPAQWMMPTSE